MKSINRSTEATETLRSRQTCSLHTCTSPPCEEKAGLGIEIRPWMQPFRALANAEVQQLIRFRRDLRVQKASHNRAECPALLITRREEEALAFTQVPRQHNSVEQFSSAPLIRPISVLRFWISRGFDSSIILTLRGGIFQAQREFPPKFESSNHSRDNLSREIGRTDAGG